MLDANAHRKCLRLHGNARFFQHPERISRAVAQRQDEIAAGNLLCAILRLNDRARDTATFCFDCRELRAEADLSSEVGDLLAQILHNVHQNVCSDVGLCIKENLRACARVCELLEHPVVSGIVHARVELAVRECARAALSELHVARRIEFAGIPEFPYDFLPRLRVLSALEDDRPVSRLRQNERAEHARRAEAHDDRALLGQFLPLRRGIELFLRDGGLRVVRHL